MLISVIIACLLLTVIFVQDIRTRSIWWFLPPLLFGAFVFFRWNSLVLAEVGYNMAFVFGLMAFLVLYIRLRFGKPEHPFQNYFGLGDFLFILALTPLLSFQQFVYFFTIGTFLTLVIHLVMLLFRKQATIPYAGYFSLVTMTYLVLLHCGTDPFQFIQS
jgi:Flp pilus assembly protein protease CpaA